MNNYFTGHWESDSAIMLSILQDLSLYGGQERSGTKFFIKNGTKSTKPISCKFGTTFRCMIGKRKRTYCEIEKGYLTKLREEEPELYHIFKEFSNFHFSDFKWTDITINYMPKSTSMKLHFDKINVGDSVLCAFGDYEGGNTFIENREKHKYDIHDARLEPLIFNGAEKRHFVNIVKKGDRFSLVFYNSLKKF